MSQSSIPTFDRLMNPLIKALKELGGSGTIEEIDGKVAELAGLSDGQLKVLHNPDKGSQTEVEYRLAWTRTYLKQYGILENSSRGVHKRLGEREAEAEQVGRGKQIKVKTVSLPFQTVERIDLQGWTNRLIWGDNKNVMASLLDEFEGING